MVLLNDIYLYRDVVLNPWCLPALVFSPPTPDEDLISLVIQLYAELSGSVTVYLKQIPNQPMYFKVGKPLAVDLYVQCVPMCVIGDALYVSSRVRLKHNTNHALWL